MEASDLFGALPVLRRTGRHGVRVFLGRARHRRRTALSRAPVRVRPEGVLRVGSQARHPRVQQLSMAEPDQAQQRLVRVAARALARHGLVHAYGHCSLRLDERHFLVAPSKPLRSEEHTSELQSLMRISYAVFCLNKKTIN